MLCATYAGESQGSAIADILFGNLCPSGHLSETWFFRDSDLPHIREYGIRPFDTATEQGRTYLYYLGDVRYPFGFGLSYTSFAYRDFRLDSDTYDANGTVRATVEITNTGDRAGAAVPQLYFRKVALYDNKPLQQLVGFRKILLQPGQSTEVTFEVPACELRYWNSWKKRFEVESGEYEFRVGGHCLDKTAAEPVRVRVSGAWKAPLSAVTLTCSRSVFPAGSTAPVRLTAALADAQHLCAEELPFTFLSSDEEAARIEDGRIRALKPGAVRLTARLTLDGVTAEDTIGICVTE